MASYKEIRKWEVPLGCGGWNKIPFWQILSHFRFTLRQLLQPIKATKWSVVKNRDGNYLPLFGHCWRDFDMGHILSCLPCKTPL